MTRRLTLALLVLLLAAAGTGLYLGLGSDGEGSAEPRSDAEGRAATESVDAGGPGALAIPADRAHFATLEGDSASIADFQGRAVVLNLWGTWCPPCRREIPHLVDLQREIVPRGGTVVGLAVDSGDPEEIRAFLDGFGADYPIWLARTRDVVNRFQAQGFPTTLIVDREGVIRERFLGPQTEQVLLDALEPYLAEG